MSSTVVKTGYFKHKHGIDHYMTSIKVSEKDHMTGCGYPMGTKFVHDGVMFTTCIPFKHSLRLIIYNTKGDVVDHINMTDHMISSGVYSCIRKGHWQDDWSYCYEADGVRVVDPFMKNSTAKRRFGDDSIPFDNGRLYVRDFDWEKDSMPNIPFNEVVAYQLHVRGFTAHSSSGVKNKGKFAGVTEKIPYLISLGINQIILMPCYEFDEIIRPLKNGSMENIDYRMDLSEEAPKKINFWGFTNGCYFMPKGSFSNGEPVNEFKSLIKAAHLAGIEVIMRFYFPDSANKAFIPEILKFWACEYHVDGFFLMGSDIPIDMIAADMYLRDRKIYNNFFDKDSLTCRKYGYNRNMAFVNADFMNVCRKFLKSDENQIADFLYRQRLNPSDVHTVNYITDHYGFTLNDLVTYDYKHNEANNEDNCDGENFNYSWNCGVEGRSAKRSVVRLRTKQIKNALVFLLLAQGVPMLNAGDEYLNTQNGNNNPYCQDNETGWTLWRHNKQSEEIYAFLKMLILLRRSHPILHPDHEFRIMDYAACNFPDLSYHQDQAWSPRFDNHLRHIGVMICGKYARKDRLTEDDFFYIAYNMHWEDHTFALPKLPKGLKWDICFLTCDESAGAVCHKTLGETAEKITVPDRCIAVLISAPDPAEKENGKSGQVSKKNTGKRKDK